MSSSGEESYEIDGGLFCNFPRARCCVMLGFVRLSLSMIPFIVLLEDAQIHVITRGAIYGRIRLRY